MLYSFTSNRNILHVFCSPLRSRMPFNWKTPFGYLIAFFLETSAFYSIVLGCVPLVCFLVGSCSFFTSFAKDITEAFRILDIDYRKTKNRKRPKQTGNITESFRNVVQLFADAKQLSRNLTLNFLHRTVWNNDQHLSLFSLVNEFNHIYEFIVTGIFAWTLSAIASSLLVVQKELVEYNQSNEINFRNEATILFFSSTFVLF